MLVRAYMCESMCAGVSENVDVVDGGAREREPHTPAVGGAPESAGEVVKVSYSTWGSFGQYGQEIIILRDGTVIEPRELASRYGVSKGDRMSVNVGGVDVLIEDRSSRKNREIEVIVPAEHVLAIINDIRTSSGWKGFRVVRGPGEVVCVLDQDERIVDNKKVVDVYKAYYYVNGQMRAMIRREYGGRRTELLGRPRIKVHVKNGEIVVAGDTFPIREVLKGLGFRWSHVYREWHASARDGVEGIIERLREHAEVEEA